MALGLVSQRLRPLRTGSRKVSLDFDPAELSLAEVILMILVFVARQALHVLGLANDFKIVGEQGGSKAYVLPDLQVSMPFRITREQLQAYATAVGSYNIENVVNDRVQLCFLLSALSEPAMLLLLGHCVSPIRPLGAVNVKNTFELLDPGFCGVEKLLNMGKAEVHAVLLPNARAVKRGLEIDVETSIIRHTDGQAKVAFRQVFTMLQFMKTRSEQASEGEGAALIKNFLETKPVDFAMEPTSTLQWARICKDYNPIHTSNIAAKVFGFPGVIAHGNHVVARALTRLQSSGEELQSNVSTFVKVQFKRPVPLASALSAQVVTSAGGESQLRISKSAKVCVVASIRIVVDLSTSLHTPILPFTCPCCPIVGWLFVHSTDFLRALNILRDTFSIVGRAKAPLRHERSAGIPVIASLRRQTMAGWLTLPAELKQCILGYILDDLTVKFSPRHASTRSTKKKLIEERNTHVHDDMITSLLLVAKAFVAYQELEPALLKTANISLEGERSLAQLTKRYTDKGICSISRLQVRLSHLHRYRGTRIPAFLTRILASTSGFRALRSVTITEYHKSIPLRPGHIFTDDEVVALASGNSLHASRTQLGRNAMRTLFTGHILCWLYQPWIVSFLLSGDNGKFERRVRWPVEGASGEGFLAEITNKIWCVRLFTKHGVLTCPQRIDSPCDRLFCNEEEYRKTRENFERTKLDAYYHDSENPS